ncbi:MAG: M67 family metallopeptidase [Candidatus Omnitrophica bacterium]|nr:M67 family metallopeptidase [Candidatus Omnitrophota bacterium]
MLVIGKKEIASIREQAEQGYPDEICGLFLGSFEQEGSLRRVAAARPAENLNKLRGRDRYELNPLDYQRIEKEAAERGWEVIGVYHSHPDHPSKPSETDRRRAEEIWESSESWSYMILEVTRGKVVSWRSWVLRDRQFGEETTQVADESRAS